MKKKNYFIAGLLFLFAMVLASFALLLGIKSNSEESEKEIQSNLFKYIVDFEDKDYTFSCRGLKYGMASAEILKTENLKEDALNDWYILDELELKNVPIGETDEVISELKVVQRYAFDEEGFFAKTIYLYMDAKYEEKIRELLYQQAEAYMPEVSGIMTNKPDPVYEYTACNEQIKSQPKVYWVDVVGDIEKTLDEVKQNTRVDLSIEKNMQGVLEISLRCGTHLKW